MVLSSRTIRKAVFKEDFRKLVPEWKDTYDEVDSRMAVRMASGKCSSCGILKGIFPGLKTAISEDSKLAERVRKYFNVRNLDIIENVEGRNKLVRVASQA